MPLAKWMEEEENWKRTRPEKDEMVVVLLNMARQPARHVLKETTETIGPYDSGGPRAKGLGLSRNKEGQKDGGGLDQR